MKQTKSLTRSQRNELVNRYGYTGDTYKTRFIRETKETFEVEDDKGRHVIYNKKTKEASYGSDSV